MASRSLTRACATARTQAARITQHVASSAARGMATSAAAGSELQSFTRALFSGRIVSESVYPYPQALTPEAKATLGMLVDPVTSFFDEKNDAAKNDDTSSVPAEVTASLKEMGAFGLQVPEELGGVGLTNSGYARMVEIVGGHDLGVGIYLGAHQSIGYKGIILYGTEEQKKKYLPSLASGDKIAAFALTEPGAGSDAAGIKTRATLSADGKHWIINGAKIWISNGNIADVFTLFAKTSMKDPVTGEVRDKVTAFIVERGHGGVTSGPPEKKMGIKCSPTAEVYLENVHVPVENVLGEVGSGFKIAMGILNNGRFGMGAALTGTMKTLIAGVTAHASQRAQFGKKLKEYSVIKGKIATMASRAYATESLAYLLAANMDRGMTDYQLEAAVSKVLASDSAWFCADEAIQIMGGLGFMKALPYERIMRDLRIFRIFEGANEILRQMVGLAGIQTAAKELEPIQRAMKAPLSNVGVLAPFAVTLAKSRLGIYDKPTLSWAPTPLRPAAEIIENASGQFGDAVRNLIIKHGKKIIEKQLLVDRVADVVIDLTAATAAVARATKAHEAGIATAAHEIALANLYAEEAKHRMSANIKAFSGSHSKLNKLRHTVADQVFEAGRYNTQHPLGV